MIKLSHLIISFLLGLSNARVFGQKSQIKTIKIKMDVTVEDLRVTVNAGSLCEEPCINAKLSLKNKRRSYTDAVTKLELKVDGVIVENPHKLTPSPHAKVIPLRQSNLTPTAISN